MQVPQKVKECGVEQLVFSSKNGKTIPYCQGVYSPEQPNSYAMLLFFHGAGERGDNNLSQLFHGVQQFADFAREHRFKLVVLAPQCPNGQQWVNVPWGSTAHTLPEEPADPMKLALELLDSKITEFNVDKNRIYVSGLSMGGYGAWDAVSRRPDFFAAAFPVCGGADELQAEKLKNLPVLIYHGELDTAVLTQRSRNMYAALKQAGSQSVTYVEVPGGLHDSWNPAYKNPNNLVWFFSQKKH